MSLTEEEKNLIAIFRGSEYHQDKVVVDLVDRLLAENEELKRPSWRTLQMDAARLQSCILQAQLDAIKKVVKDYIAGKAALVDMEEALDKLIGGEE